MKRILLATSALAATAGFASAQGGLTVTGTASMGLVGGDFFADRLPDTQDNPFTDAYEFRYGEPIPGQSEFELITDIDVTFTMSGQTDTGLTFGASIDLDESDGDGDRGNSNAFENRSQGGEEIFISGPFGTLTMGDTDGALDWALQDIGVGGTLGDLHTTHLGYIGNNFVDNGTDGSGQIARYDYSFGDFAFAVSVDIHDGEAPPAGDRVPIKDDVLSVGAKYSFSLPALQLGVGVGWQERSDFWAFGRDPEDFRDGGQARGVSLDAEFDNGFRAILNWAHMGNDPATWTTAEEKWHGIGLSYRMDDWLFAANYGRIDEKLPNASSGHARAPRWQKGYALVVNYDLGGGAEVQFGYRRSTCATEVLTTAGGGLAVFQETDERRCGNEDKEEDFSLGVAMSF